MATQKTFGREVAGMCHHVLAWAATVLAVATAFSAQAADSPATRSEKSGAVPSALSLQTATTHPMNYYISLTPNWSPDRKWPVLVAPSAHYGDKGRSLAVFAAERDARKASFILVAPFVINADRVRAPCVQDADGSHQEGQPRQIKRRS